MKRSKFSKAQIAAALNEAERGVAVKAIYLIKHAISDATIYNWKALWRAGCLGVEAVERPRSRERELKNDNQSDRAHRSLNAAPQAIAEIGQNQRTN